MISFIIIGKNEGWKLPKCIQSIYDTIDFNEIQNFEIIYVDSNSIDNSLEQVKSFKKVKTFQLKGAVNAAIARNIGVKEAKGNIFCFIDGDMELNKKSFLNLFDENEMLKYEFISGDFENFYYDHKNSMKSIGREMYHKNTKINKEYTTGGLFLIDRDTWYLVNGMKDIFKRSQDMDLGLRLSRKGIYLHRLPIKLALHHTIAYRTNRLWSQLFDSTHLYGRSLLYRVNLFNINTLKLIIKQDYSLLVLVTMSMFAVIFLRIDFLLIYLSVLAFRSVLKKHIKYLFYFLIRDIKVLFGFFLFHPRMKKVSYSSIK